MLSLGSCHYHLSVVITYLPLSPICRYQLSAIITNLPLSPICHYHLSGVSPICYYHLSAVITYLPLSPISRYHLSAIITYLLLSPICRYHISAVISNSYGMIPIWLCHWMRKYVLPQRVLEDLRLQEQVNIMKECSTVVKNLENRMIQIEFNNQDNFLKASTERRPL